MEPDKLLRQNFENWVMNECRQIGFPVYNSTSFSIIVNHTRYLVVKANIPDEFIGVAM